MKDIWLRVSSQPEKMSTEKKSLVDRFLSDINEVLGEQNCSRYHRGVFLHFF